MRRSSVDWFSIDRCSTLYKYEHLAVVVVVDNSDARYLVPHFLILFKDIKSMRW